MAARDFAVPRLQTPELERLLNQQQAVADLGQQALAGVASNVMFDRAVQAVAGALEVEYAKVLELLPDGGTLLLRAGTGWKPGLVGRATVGSDLDSQAGYTLQREHFVIVEDLATERRFTGPPLLVEHGVVSGLSTVIGGRERPFGVLGAHTRQRRAFTEADAQFLRAVANILAASVERERAEAALQERALLLRQAQRLGRVGSYIYDTGTNKAAWSEETYRITGRDPSLPPPGIEEYLSFFTPESQAVIRESITRYEADGQPFELDLELVRPDGERRHIVQRGGMQVDASGGRSPRIIGVVQDVTELRRMAEQLQQVQRLEAVGRLAAGVAHDFNNLLTPVVGFASACREKLAADDPMRADLAEIQKAAESATMLTRQLLAVGRRQLTQPEVIGLNEVVRDTLNLLRGVLGARVEVECRLPEEVASVKMDRGQVEQVLTNLAANARDAMPEGGTFMIETANVVLDRAFARTHPEITPGAHVMLVVADTGHGMTDEIMARAFDPFFTTKEFGKGTGLGLATVHSIVRQCGGSVDVESAPGRGTTFRLYFPSLFQRPSQPGAKTRAEAPKAQSGVETVLLVDDNEFVRTFARRVLASQGYNVLDTGTGDDAVDLFAGQTRSVDMLITDVVMPGMSGPELASRLTGRHPGLKVLFISGYADEAIGSRGAISPDIAFLPKPFTPDALTQKVREVLDGPEPGPDLR
jgi:signal transduction histidine kinase/ActR/RegA family two-component response regulator